MNLLKRIALAWIQHREFLAALARLRRLSDRQLSDLGLARDDVVRVAYEEAERRAAAAFAPARPEARGARGGAADSVLGGAEVVNSGRPAS